MRQVFGSVLFALAVAMIPATSAHAQLTVGGFVGVNFSDLNVSDLDVSETVDSRTGFMAGGWVGKNLGLLFALQLEAYYTPTKVALKMIRKDAHERLLFGTDNTVSRQMKFMTKYKKTIRGLLDAVGMKKATGKMIMGGTMARMFGLDG